MPSFGWRRSDGQAADVVTSLCNAWGNATPTVTASQVSTVRTAVAVPGK